MKTLALALYIMWSLINSIPTGSSVLTNINLVTTTIKLPVIQEQNQCYYCSKILSLDNKASISDFYKNCLDKRPCDLDNQSCGINIHIPQDSYKARLEFKCISKNYCKTYAFSPVQSIRFSSGVYGYECCDSSLCNNHTNLNKTQALFNSFLMHHNTEKQCLGFYRNHKKLSLTSESDNKGVVQDGDNLILTNNKSEDEYIKKYGTASTWYAVFDAIDPNEEVLITSFKKDNKNNFIQDKTNKELMEKYRIFDATEYFIYLCDFEVGSINIILNKITRKNEPMRLFGIVLTDQDTNRDFGGIFERIKAKHNINEADIHILDHHNTTSTQNNTGAKTLANSAMVLMPIMQVLNRN